jgi:hypothetical protein
VLDAAAPAASRTIVLRSATLGVLDAAVPEEVFGTKETTVGVLDAETATPLLARLTARLSATLGVLDAAVPEEVFDSTADIVSCGVTEYVSNAVPAAVTRNS